MNARGEETWNDTSAILDVLKDKNDRSRATVALVLGKVSPHFKMECRRIWSNNGFEIVRARSIHEGAHGDHLLLMLRTCQNG
jgi:hypothetical protein